MLKIGIVGSGFGLYGLLPAFNSIRGCKVVCISGSKTERLVEYCRKIGLENIYSDWRRMLDEQKLDAIAIATPPNIQYKIAEIAIKKNLDIFAEKPLAANLKQAQRLLRLADEKKVIHCVDFLFIKIPALQKAKKLINNKKYGNLIYTSLNWEFLAFDIENKISSWKTDKSKGGGALSFYFSHALYYLEQFGYKIMRTRGKLSYSNESINGGDTGVDLRIEFQNGVKGEAHMSCVARGMNNHTLKLVCEKGTLVLENNKGFVDDFKLRLINNSKMIKDLKIAAIEDRKEEDERVKYVRLLAKDFIASCKSRKTMNPSFKEGARVQKLIEKIRSTC